MKIIKIIGIVLLCAYSIIAGTKEDSLCFLKNEGSFFVKNFSATKSSVKIEFCGELSSEEEVIAINNAIKNIAKRAVSLKGNDKNELLKNIEYDLFIVKSYNNELHRRGEDVITTLVKEKNTNNILVNDVLFKLIESKTGEFYFEMS